jgi:hypothetical protein
MKYVDIDEIQREVPISSERTFPAAPFPRKYIHCAFGNLESAVYAVRALRNAGYDPATIHVMASWDFVEAVERRQQRQNLLAKALSRAFSFFDDGFGDVYLHQALQGCHILAVCLSHSQQMQQVSALLALHDGRQIKYVDAWMTVDLLPVPQHFV